MSRMSMSYIVEQMKQRVRVHTGQVQEFCEAFIEFANAYNTFNDEKNIDNWKNAKDKQNKVLNIAYHTHKPSDNIIIDAFMNDILKNQEFVDFMKNIWREEEERQRQKEKPRSKEKQRSQEKPRSKEEPRRQEKPRSKEEPQKQNKNNSKIYPIPKTRPQALTVLNLKENATKNEIRKAYLRNSLKNHPDKNPDNQTESTARQQQVAEAYNLLKGGKIRRTTQRKPLKKSKKPKSMKH